MDLQLSRLRRNLSLYYAYTILSNLIFQRGIFILFFVHLGFSGAEIGLFQSVLFIANFLLEVPTGVIADRWGRKYSVAAGLILLAGNGIGMITAPAHFGLFLALIVIQATGFALMSGANSALLYDTLRELRRDGEYLRVSARVHAIGSAMLGAAMLAGGLLKELSWNAVYLSYAAAFLIAAFVVMLMHEPRIEREEGEGRELPARAALRFLWHPTGRHVAIFILACALYDAGATPYFIFGQILLDSHGFQPYHIGFFYAAVQFVSSGAYLLAGRLANAFTLQTVSYVSLGFSALLMGATGLAPPIVSLVLLFVIAVLPEAMYVMTEAHLQGRLPSAMRATLLSLNTLIQSIGIAVGYLYAGSTLDLMAPANALALLAVFPLLSIGVFLFYFRLAVRSGPSGA